MKTTEKLLDKARLLRNEKPLVNIDDLRSNIERNGGKHNNMKFSTKRRKYVMPTVIVVIIIAAVIVNPFNILNITNDNAGAVKLTLNEKEKYSSSANDNQSLDNSGVIKNSPLVNGSGNYEAVPDNRNVHENPKNHAAGNKINSDRYSGSREYAGIDSENSTSGFASAQDDIIDNEMENEITEPYNTSLSAYEVNILIDELNTKAGRKTKFTDNLDSFNSDSARLAYVSEKLADAKNSPEVRSSKQLSAAADAFEKLLRIIQNPELSNFTYHHKDTLNSNNLIWYNVQGINFLELSEKELEKIGIHISDTAVSFITERIYYGLSPSRAVQLAPLGYDTSRTKPIIVRTMNVITKNFEDNGYDMPYTGWDLDSYSRLAPVCQKYLNYGGSLDHSPILKDGDSLMKYIHYIQKESMDDFYRAEAENNLLMKKEIWLRHAETFEKEIKIGNDLILKRLVPVAVKLRDDSLYKKVVDRSVPLSGTSCQHLYLWFVPTEEFISALPEKYSLPLRKELDVLHKYETNEVSYEQACKGLTEVETFFDICRMKSGAIEYLTVFPNPASVKANVKFLVTEPRKVSILLHNMNGQTVRIIKKDAELPAGEHEMPVNLEGLAGGMYMVSIQSAEQEQVIYKFIIR